MAFKDSPLCSCCLFTNHWCMKYPLMWQARWLVIGVGCICCVEEWRLLYCLNKGFHSNCMHHYSRYQNSGIKRLNFPSVSCTHAYKFNSQICWRGLIFRSAIAFFFFSTAAPKDNILQLITWPFQKRLLSKDSNVWCITKEYCINKEPQLKRVSALDFIKTSTNIFSVSAWLLSLQGFFYKICNA